MISPTQFIEDWVNNEEWWFTSSDYIDAYITLNYQHLLDIDLTNEDSITKIIIFDQLPRHILRKQSSNHIILYYLQKALTILKSTNKKYLEDLSPSLWCFSMLPLRHTYDISVIIDVMKKTWDKLNITKNEKDRHIIKKFLKATYQKCPLDDQSSMIQYYHNNIYNYPSTYLKIEDIKNEFHDILDLNNYEGLLDISIFTNLKITGENIILSLSGGVDSIICSVILKNYDIVVHINYCNRPSSNREEDFVKAWCEYLRVPLYVRRINEINRPMCRENDLRDIYETYTRNVRFATYKTVNSFVLQAKKHNYRPLSLMPIKSKDIQTIPKVILGHNKDDCLENILTNIAHENHYENLNGMSDISIHDNIQFLRPFLNITKNEIRNFAYKMGYLFLPNSTPEWSQRGMIRSTVVPVLEKWDNRIIEGLFNLTGTITDLHEILDSFIESFLAKTIFNEKNNMYELQSNNIPKLVLFWKAYIMKLFKCIPSNKSLNNLIFKIKKWDKSSDMIVIISKNITLNFSKDKCEINFIK